MDRIAGAIAALDRASAASASEVCILILANDCDDDTARVARNAARAACWSKIEVVSERLSDALAHAGGARRTAVERAFEIFGENPRDTLLSTDADARVRTNAMLCMERAFGHGADLVLAKIECVSDPFEPVSEEALEWGRPGVVWRHRVRQLVETIRTGCVPNPALHDDYGGAGIGIRVAAYRGLNGFPAVPSNEDKLLVMAADHAELTVNRQSGAIVDVLARAKGRATGGMAHALAQCAQAAAQGITCLVERHDVTLQRIALDPSHARAFPATISEWEPAHEAIIGLDRAIAAFG